MPAPPAAGSRVVFVHTLDGAELPIGTIVALTGHALVACHQRNLAATVIDDHVDRRALLLEGREDYLRWQIEWFKTMSQVGTASPDALLTGRNLLHGPLDAVIANARLLDAVVGQLNPSEITYHGPPGSGADPWHGEHLYFSAALGDEPLTRTLLRTIAANRGLPLDERDADIARTTPTVPSPAARLRREVQVRGGAGWNLRGRPQPRSGPRSLVLWTMGYGLRPFVQSERDRGLRVVALERQRGVTGILEPHLGWLRRRGPAIPTGVAEATGAPAGASLDPLIASIDRASGVSGSGEALRSRVEAFTSRVAPAIDRIASDLQGTLDSMRIQRVAAANPWTVAELGCLVAVSRMSPVPHRTLVQHGDHAFPYDCWVVRELPSFDELACSDPSIPSSMALTAQALGEPVPAFSYSAPRIVDLRRRVKRPPSQAGTERSDRRTVCYVPTGYQGDNNQLCGAGFDDAWYARWQLALLDAMQARPEIDFLWKGAPSGIQVDVDPMEGVIMARGGNVEYTATPLRSVLGRVDRVFTDFASTALYECVRLHVPTLCVSFTPMEDIRPAARELLDPCLQPVPDQSTAVQLFQRFLDADGTRWLVPEARFATPAM